MPALPGEAAAVLNKAMSSGIIKAEHKERTARLLKSLQDRADADKKGLPQQEAEAAKSAAGEADVKLGEVYYGFGDYQKAADVDQQGAAERPGEASRRGVRVPGACGCAAQEHAEAKKAFANLKNVPNISPRVLKLYEVYAATVGVPVQSGT